MSHIVKKPGIWFLAFGLLGVIITIAFFLSFNQKTYQDATLSAPIQVHFKNKTSQAQVELDIELFSNLVNQAFRDGAILYFR